MSDVDQKNILEHRPSLSHLKIEISDDVAKFGDTYYPIANIGAVSVASKKIGVKGVSFLFILLGLVLWSIYSSKIWLVLTGLGSLGLFSKPEYEFTLTLATSSGNQQVFKTRNKDDFEAVRSALESAISRRRKQE